MTAADVCDWLAVDLAAFPAIAGTEVVVAVNCLADAQFDATDRAIVTRTVFVGEVVRRSTNGSAAPQILSSVSGPSAACIANLLRVDMRRAVAAARSPRTR